MNTILSSLISKYEIEDLNDEMNSMKEIIQEIVLSGLARNGFFSEAAFYGGTALRIFYGLDRFSEDLDFALLSPNKDFDLTKYFEGIEREIKSLGFCMEVQNKEKTNKTVIDSAVLRGNTKEMILSFFPNEILKKDGNYKDIKIKFEVDTNPPLGATYEMKPKQLPFSHMVRVYDMPSLFAGKLHAVLCRNWKTRIKGRDLFDYLFYLKMDTKINMELLRNKLIDSDHINIEDNFDDEVLHEMLTKRFKEIDFENAKLDVDRFLHNDHSSLEFFNTETFIQLTNDYFMKNRNV